MTKAEAIKAMEEGHKVAHNYFTPDEWMTIENGMFKFEDGCRCEYDRFWYSRREDCWLTGWRIWNAVH